MCCPPTPQRPPPHVIMRALCYCLTCSRAKNTPTPAPCKFASCTPFQQALPTVCSPRLLLDLHPDLLSHLQQGRQYANRLLPAYALPASSRPGSPPTCLLLTYFLHPRTSCLTCSRADSMLTACSLHASAGSSNLLNSALPTFPSNQSWIRSSGTGSAAAGRSNSA